MIDRELCGATLSLVGDGADLYQFDCSRSKGHKKRHRATGTDVKGRLYVVNWKDGPAVSGGDKNEENADD